MAALARRVTKDDRVDVRLQSHQKELLRDAAATAGLTISAFLLSVGLREARKITTIKLNREEATTFAELLENPPVPTPAAVASMKKARRYPRK
jgi:uncharacterized protein (DUF1778 family)